MTKHILVHKKSGKLSVGFKTTVVDGNKKEKCFLVFDNMKFKDTPEKFKTLMAVKKVYSIYRSKNK